MRSVLVAGAFGQGNPGDEAHLRSFVRRLDGWDIVATTSDPAGTERVHGCRAVRSAEAAEVARHASRSDAVVFAGGTVFKVLQTSTRRPPLDLLRRGLALAAGAKLMGKPVCMLGVGAGRLDTTTAQLLARALAGRASLLVLRDEESAAVLAAAGVRPPFRIGTDPAWSLFAGEAPSPSRTDDVVVALSHHAGGDGLASYIAGALSPLAAEGTRLMLQPWQSPADRELAANIAYLVEAEIVEEPADLVEARDHYASAKLVVGFRFHACMAAAAAGTPFVAFGHEPKLTALARRLGQRCAKPADPSFVLQTLVRTALDDPPPDARAVAGEVACAEEGFALLKLLLDGPDASEPEDVAGLVLAPSPASSLRPRGAR